MAAHVDDGEGGASVSEPDSLAGRELGAAIGPEEREERPGGGRAPHGCRSVGFHQTGLLHVDGHVCNGLCGSRRGRVQRVEVDANKNKWRKSILTSTHCGYSYYIQLWSLMLPK